MSSENFSIMVGITIGLLMGLIPFVSNIQDKLINLVKKLIIKSWI
jgi:type III secretory pathway component EscS